MAARRWLIVAGAVGALAAAALLVLRSTGEPSRQGASSRDSAASDLIEEVVAMSSEAAFENPSGPWDLDLPADHGGHAGSRAESWVVAAHLETETGVPVGLHFSLTRFGLRGQSPGAETAPWEMRAVYRAHVALARRESAELTGEERVSRGGGVAGHDRDAREVWLDHWRLAYGQGPDGRSLTLFASAAGQPIRLVLTPAKPARSTNADGSAPLRGFMVSRLRAEGEIGVGDRRSTVSGLGWLGHLWGELPLPGGPLAQDRLIVQLDDGTDLSLVRSRRRDGRGAATLDGLIIDASGTARPVSGDALEMVPTARWQDSDDGGNYPVAWRVTGQDLDLRVTPMFEDQLQDFAVPGWIGAMRAEGMVGGIAATGAGTLQLTGYESP